MEAGESLTAEEFREFSEALRTLMNENLLIPILLAKLYSVESAEGVAKPSIIKEKIVIQRVQ
jgi:hypothetical protein